MSFLLGFLLILTSVFLIMLVLVQRGRGGGLVGALGGAGGQSALGTKAGDVFTRITIFAAAFWILLCVVTVKVLNTETSRLGNNLGANAPPEAIAIPKDKTDDSPSTSERPRSSSSSSSPATGGTPTKSDSKDK